MRSKFGVCNLKPGITGLAQINGRDTVSPMEKVRWDVEYLKNFGLVMDLKILFATIPKILRAIDVVEGYCMKEHDVGQ
jgi:O-antigen biosynthesis protein WbqP